MFLGIDRRRRLLEGEVVAQHEIDRLAGRHFEVGAMAAQVGLQLDVGAKHERIRADDEAHAGVLFATDPRDGDAVVRAHGQLGAKVNRAAQAPHDTYEVAVRARVRHQVDDDGCAVRRLPMRLEDQRLLAIATRDLRLRMGRRDRPAAVVLVAEQAGEHRGGIEARPAQPVDRAVAPDERRGLTVADHRVVFDLQGHRRSSSCVVRLLVCTTTNDRNSGTRPSVASQTGFRRLSCVS